MKAHILPQPSSTSSLIDLCEDQPLLPATAPLIARTATPWPGLSERESFETASLTGTLSQATGNFHVPMPQPEIFRDLARICGPSAPPPAYAAATTNPLPGEDKNDKRSAISPTRGAHETQDIETHTGAGLSGTLLSSFQTIVSHIKIGMEIKAQLAQLSEAAIQAQESDHPEQALILYESIAEAARKNALSVENTVLRTYRFFGNGPLDEALLRSNNASLLIFLLRLCGSVEDESMHQKDEAYGLIRAATKITSWAQRQSQAVRTILLTSDDDTMYTAVKDFNDICEEQYRVTGHVNHVAKNLIAAIDESGTSAFVVADKRHAPRTLTYLMASHRGAAVKWIAGLAAAGRPWFLMKSDATIIAYAVKRGLGDALAQSWQMGTTLNANENAVLKKIMGGVKEPTTQAAYLSFLENLAKSGIKDRQKYTVFILDAEVAPLLSTGFKNWVAAASDP